MCITGARTVIANAAYSFLHPWSHKGNMAVRLKKLHESAQARYDKSKEGLVSAVLQQPAGDSSAPLPLSPPDRCRRSCFPYIIEPYFHF